MLRQTIVSRYPSLSSPGKEHNNARNTSIFRSGVSAVNTRPGTILIATDSPFVDHTRLSVDLPSAANTTAATGNFPVINMKQDWLPSNYTRNYIDQNVLTSTDTFYNAGEQLRLGFSTIAYVICEKAINPNNPVYVRFQNPVGANQGLGFVTDVTSADVRLLTGAMFWGVDSATYITAKDPNINAAADAARMGLSAGFAIVAVSLNFNQPTRF